MRIDCPGCGAAFQVDDGEETTRCPNPRCHTPYVFRCFADEDSASQFHADVPSWKTKHLLQLRGAQGHWAVGYFNDPVQPYRIRSISSLVDEEILRAIQAGSADNLGGPITLIEIQRRNDGKVKLRRIEPLEYASPRGIPPHMRLFSPFCTRLRTAAAAGTSGDEMCMAFDTAKVEEYIGSPPFGPRWHFCWCGLVDYMVPVIVHNEIVGVLFSGQKRLDSPEADRRLRRLVGDAEGKLSLRPGELLSLALGGDVQVVNEEEIQSDLQRLAVAARRLEKEAQQQYAIERQVRERYFLEEIRARLVEIAALPHEGEAALWTSVEPILSRVLDFVESFDTAALLQEKSSGVGVYDLVAATGRVPPDAAVTIQEESIPRMSAHHLGPLFMGKDENRTLRRHLSQKLLPYEMAVGYLVRIPLRSSRDLLLFLSAENHPCVDAQTGATCEQCSPQARLFLTQLASSLSEEFDVLLSLQSFRAAERRKTAFLTRSAHSLSLPIESILLDSDELVEELGRSHRLYELANHNFNEARSLQLIVQSILHGAEEETQAPNPEFYQRSILEPLGEACEMFAGEATDKGCDIQGIVEIDGREISLKPTELGSEYVLYARALYDPLRDKYGASRGHLIRKKDILASLLVEGTEIPVTPERLPEKCYELLRGRAGVQHDAVAVHLVLEGKRVEVSPDEVARKCMPKAQIVPDELDLAFKNLLNNAVKYSYRSGSSGPKRYVEVVCKLVGWKYYEISISNYGIGIEDYEIRDGLIWKPRYRGVRSRDRNRTGSGLGLSHVKRAVERIHGGKIEVQSLPQPGGAYLTKFTLTLPVLQSYRLHGEANDEPAT